MKKVGRERHNCDIGLICFKPGKSPLGYKFKCYFGWYEVFAAISAVGFNDRFGVTRESHHIVYRREK